MEKRRKYKHEAPSAETVKRRATERGGGYDSYLDSKIPKYKADDGENRIRIVPCARINGEPWGDKAKWEDSWGIKIHVHFGIGTDRGSYLCPKRMGVGDCPICESIAEIALEDEEKAKKLRPNVRSLCYLIDRADEKAGPQVWSMPWTKMEQQIQKLSNDPDTGAIIDVSNPEEGYDIIFTKSGKEERTDYGGIAIARKASPLCRNEDTQDDWMEYIHENPLPNILKFYEYKYMEKVFMGKAGSKDKKEDEDDAKEDDKKDRRRRSEPDNEDNDTGSSRRRASKDEPEDDGKDTRRRSSRADGDDDTSSRRSSRSTKEDDGDTERSSRRSREEPDDEDRSSRRRSSREDDDVGVDARSSRRSSKDDSEDTGRSSRRSPKEEDNDPPPRSSRRSSNDDDGDTSRRRSSRDDNDTGSSRRRSSKEDEEEAPFEEEPEDDGKGKKTSRPAKDDDEPRASTKAKAGMDNLKRRHKGDD